MTKQKNVATDWTDIAVTIDGIEVTGSFSVDSTDWMTVRMTEGGSKSAHGGPAAGSVARLILCELYAEANPAKK
jgi:hypothetical protein